MVETFPAPEEEVILEARDKYIEAFIMLLHGNTFTWGTVISCKWNAKGNVIGNAHVNPVLDTHPCDIEFANGKVTALMANVIARAMLLMGMTISC